MGEATCGALELLPASPRATPTGGSGRGRPLGRSIPCVRGCVLSPSATLSVCEVASVLPTLPGCQHFLKGSEEALEKCGPPQLSAVTQDHTMVASLAVMGTCGCGHEGGVSESLPWLLPSVLFVFVIQVVNTWHTGRAIPVPVLGEGSFQVLAGGPPS